MEGMPLMDTPTFGFLIFFVLAGLTSAGLAIPMILGKLKPNGMYGFRTPKTLSSDDVWYKSNAYMGRLLLGWGLAVSAGSVILYLVPALRQDLAAYNLSVTGIVLGGLALIFALGVRYSHTVPELPKSDASRNPTP
jgi:hypothetical protein